MPTTTEWTLPTMSCGHCARAVTEAVRGEDPQAQVQIDLETKRVQIDSSASEAALRHALVEAGYEPAAA